jgi:hypothetical protein
MSRKDDLWEQLGEATRTGKPTGDILREYLAEMSGKAKPAAPSEPNNSPPRQGVVTVDAMGNKHYDFELFGTGMLESEWIKEHGDVFKKGER